MPQAINKRQIFQLLNMEYVTGNKLITASPDFPKPLNQTKRARETKLFDYQQVMNWIAKHQKGFCRMQAQQAISGKLWPIHTQERTEEIADHG